VGSRCGRRVTTFNRGVTPNQLPPAVERLRGNRSRPCELAAALGNRSFDAVVDMTLYNGRDAAGAIDVLADVRAALAPQPSRGCSGAVSHAAALV